MKTASQIANDAKVRLQKEVVNLLRKGCKDSIPDTWRQIRLTDRLWSELGTYDLRARERRSHLNKVAFPDCNLAEVDAALEAGNNLNRLYDLARGRATLQKDSAGRFVAGKKGLKIVKL